MRTELLLVLASAVLLSGCQACTQLGAPKAYQCERGGPASQCPGGWRCGLDGFCFDPTLARPTACDSDADCATTWRCGTPLTGAPSTTRVCRARGVGAAFTCASDLDCEGAWRCGPASVCLDTSREALRESAAPALSPSRVGPLLETGDVEVAISDQFDEDTGCAALTGTREVVSVTSRNGAVQRVWLPGDVPAGVSVACDAGLPGSANELRRPARLERFLLDAGVVVATGQLDGTTLVVFDGGLSCAVSPRGDTRCEDLGFQAHAVRISETGFAVLTGRTGYKLWTPDGGVSPLLTVGGAPSLNVVVPVTTASGFVLAAATPVGLAETFVRSDGRQNADGGWPVAASWSFGPCLDGGVETLDVRADTASNLVLVAGRESSVDRVDVFGSEPGVPLSCGLVLPTLRTFFSRSCPEGATLVWATAGGFGNRDDATSETRCRGVDGGVEVRFGEVLGRATIGSPSLLFAEPMFDRRTLFARANPLRAMALAPWGTLWLQAGASYQPLLLDRLPLSPWTLPDGGAAEFHLRRRPLAGSTLGTKATVGGGAFTLAEGLGLVLLRPENAPVVAVSTEQPELGLLSAPFLPSREQQAVVARTPEGLNLLAATTSLDTFAPPFRLTPQVTTDGGTLVLLSAFDALLSADVTEILHRPFDPRRSLPDLPELRVRTVPLSRSPITSLLALTPTRDEAGRARLSEGYLITSGRVFRFEGDNETVWRSRELEMPFGEPFALVAQKERARVGYRSGEVYSLPSRVLLAPAIAPGRLEDLTVHCERLMGLSGDAVWTLVVPSGQALGTWQRTALPTAPGPGAVFSRLDGDLLVVSTDGKTQRIGLTCR